MSRILYCGDTLPLTVLVTTDAVAYAIPSNANVRASLVSIAGRELAGPWIVANPGNGSWSSGVVVVPVNGAHTKDLDPQSCRIEIQIETPGESVTRQTNETISLRRAGVGSSQTLAAGTVVATVAVSI